MKDINRKEVQLTFPSPSVIVVGKCKRWCPPGRGFLCLPCQADLPARWRNAAG